MRYFLNQKVGRLIASCNFTLSKQKWITEYEILARTLKKKVENFTFLQKLKLKIISMKNLHHKEVLPQRRR
jgi:hypothetical protein